MAGFCRELPAPEFRELGRMTGGNAGQLSFPRNTQRVRTDKQKSERPEKRKNEKRSCRQKSDGSSAFRKSLRHREGTDFWRIQGPLIPHIRQHCVVAEPCFEHLKYTMHLHNAFRRFLALFFRITAYRRSYFEYSEMPWAEKCAEDVKK